MSNGKSSWTTDWKMFIEAVSESFNEGLDEIAVTRRFAGQPVTWGGKVVEKRLDQEDPGIRLGMPPVKFTLSDGRHAVVNYLFLQLRKQDVDSWRNVKTGDTVQFITQIRSGIGPFPGIEWSGLAGKEGLVLLATDGARLVGTVN